MLSVQEEIEAVEKQVLRLNQKKEDLLVDLKAAILTLHEHLKQDQQEAERAGQSATTSEDRAAEREALEWKVGALWGSVGPTSQGALNGPVFHLNSLCHLCLWLTAKKYLSWQCRLNPGPSH